MSGDDIDLTLREVMATVLGADPDLVSETTPPSTLGAWTSIRHLSLVAAVEEAFSIHLSAAEIFAAQSYGALRQVVSEHVRRGSTTSRD